MKKVIVMALAALLCGCSQKASSLASDAPANPFVDEKTMTDAGKTAGFDMNVPDEIQGETMDLIQAVPDEMIQVFYGEDRQILVRKASGAQMEVSGDYNTWDCDQTIAVNGMDVHEKGDSEDAVHVMDWHDDAYAYSVSSDMALTQEEVTDLTGEIH